MLAVLQPLFAVESAEAHRSGHVDDAALLVDALRRVLAAGIAAGLSPLGAAKLALRPKHGALEFFVHVGRGTDHAAWLYHHTALAEIVAMPGIGPNREEGEKIE